MTKNELAKMLGTTRQNLSKWEKERPELIRILNLGLQADQIIKESNQLNRKLKDIRKQAYNGKLQIPKDNIDSSDILDYQNPNDFDARRIQKICMFLTQTHIIDLRTVILRALKEVQLDDSGTYNYIEKQTSKQNLLREFSKFIREMVSKNDIVEAQGTKIVQFVNENLKMDFNEKDIDVIDHIVIMYDYYSELFGIEDEKEEF
jgi:transcriptional regulator with XRE-family HTH domain